jgi:hypothetical protein
VTRAAATVARGVQARANGLNQHVKRLELLHDARAISDVDINRIYAGAFISYYSFFENAIEDLFLGLVTGRVSRVNTASLVGISSNQVAKRVVFGGQKFADWLPYNRHTIPRANAFLAGGRPFTLLSKADRNNLDDLTTLRNAAAHESTHSIRQFRRSFTDGHPLPPSQLRPSGYLRGQHSMSQRRFEFLLSQSLQIMHRLCT